MHMLERAQGCHELIEHRRSNDIIGLVKRQIHCQCTGHARWLEQRRWGYLAREAGNAGHDGVVVGNLSWRPVVQCIHVGALQREGIEDGQHAWGPTGPKTSVNDSCKR